MNTAKQGSFKKAAIYQLKNKFLKYTIIAIIKIMVLYVKMKIRFLLIYTFSIKSVWFIGTKISLIVLINFFLKIIFQKRTVNIHFVKIQQK